MHQCAEQLNYFRAVERISRQFVFIFHTNQKYTKTTTLFNEQILSSSFDFRLRTTKPAVPDTVSGTELSPTLTKNYRIFAA